MLYVAVGLTAMFGLLIFFGLRALDQATSLVFQERLRTARTVTVIIERDLMHISADVTAARATLSDSTSSTVQEDLEDLMSHLASEDSFAFFHTSGIQLLDATGAVLASDGIDFVSELPLDGADGGVVANSQILSPMLTSSAEPGFASIVVRVGNDPSGPSRIVVQLTAHDSPAAFNPSAFDPGGSISPPETATDPAEQYHLEVVGPDGAVVLLIGESGQHGAPSHHFAALRDLGPIAEPLALRHVGGDSDDEPDHVMGVVPLGDSGFTLVLEQPVDVALALPLRFRRQLLTWSGIGFIIALGLAWFTTKAVVRPTEQLTLAAKRMAQGDLESPIEVSAYDEVGTLVESLESMRQQTRRAYQAVEEANRVLESRVRARTAELGEVLSKVISAQEEERSRLARELHDDTAQTLGALAISLDRARDTVPGEASSAHLAGAKTLVTQVLQDIRRLILDLRPMVLDDMGLGPAIRWYAETRLDPEGIAWTLEADRPESRLDSHIETALFRIAQEAMNNAVKHSSAGHVDIKISMGESAARIVVSDDGKGFDAHDWTRDDHFDEHVGIAGMRERVALLSGRMEIRSEIGSGTTIDIEVPLAGDRAGAA
ncbi:MAG: hypothetical protein A2135_00285 [Actinobacteria bacterium RBG_16_67_15]|nr:MAG: hypothetical protein A2135_00285 [Actinobacteria bacterium RBG_16_67_15]